MIKGIKENLLDRKHTQHIIDYSFTKIFQPKFKLKIMTTLHLLESTIPTIILFIAA